METADQVKREQLCKDIIEVIIPDAKKAALIEFKNYTKLLKIKLKISPNEANELNNQLTIESGNYDIHKNVRDNKSLKSKLLDLYIKSIDVYDRNEKLSQEGYNAHKQSLMVQFLTLKKIEYLKKLISELSESKELPIGTKINWLGKPSELGYLIKELIDKHYIENPGKEINQKTLRQIVKLVYNTFRIKDYKNEGETSFENFYKEVRKNSLTSAGREWLTIRKIKQN